jgi:hypothetical protein
MEPAEAHGRQGHWSVAGGQLSGTARSRSRLGFRQPQDLDRSSGGQRGARDRQPHAISARARPDRHLQDTGGRSAGVPVTFDDQGTPPGTATSEQDGRATAPDDEQDATVP